jgi:hypothetical protein
VRIPPQGGGVLRVRVGACMRVRACVVARVRVRVRVFRMQQACTDSMCVQRVMCGCMRVLRCLCLCPCVEMCVCVFVCVVCVCVCVKMCMWHPRLHTPDPTPLPHTQPIDLKPSYTPPHSSHHTHPHLF